MSRNLLSGFGLFHGLSFDVSISMNRFSFVLAIEYSEGLITIGEKLDGLYIRAFETGAIVRAEFKRYSVYCFSS